jgi:hypothetical protein
VLAIDDAFAIKKNVLNTFYILTALYHAVEIYYSRAFFPDIPLYSAEHHAVSIITTTEKLYRSLGLPQSEPPRTKTWPVPLLMAAIEAKDRIYRNWAVRKMRDYQNAGDHYVKSCEFAERIQEVEEAKNCRVHLGEIMMSMDEEFIV